MEDSPKILFLDIETTPLVAYSWGPKYETNLIETKEYSKILSFSAKWLNGKQITKGWLDYDESQPGAEDVWLVEEIHGLLDSADVVVTQNGRDFDIRTLNARFIALGLPPPSPYKVVDTKIEARKYLRLPSHSLDDLCDYFGIGRKTPHEGFPLWTACMAGDRKAWKKMLAYNAHDVLLTEQLYLKLLPWMTSHPNLGLYTDRPVCPRCGSSKINFRGTVRNTTTIYQSFQCQSCGGWGRHGKNINTTHPAVSV